MPLNLPRPAQITTNKPYKSAGEDQIVVRADGQMTDTKIIFHARGTQTNGAVGIMEITWRPGDQAMHHLHRLEDEGFYVIEGQVTIHTPDGDLVLGPGEFAWGPRNIRHAYSIGPDGARVLVIQTPGTELPAFFQGISQVGQFDPADFDEFAAWAQENFGTVFFHPAQYPPGQSVPD